MATQDAAIIMIPYDDRERRADLLHDWNAHMHDYRDQLDPEPFDLDAEIAAAITRINAACDARCREAQARAKRDAEHVRRSHAAVWRSDRKHKGGSK